MDERNLVRLFFVLLCFKTLTAEPYRASHIRAVSFDTVVKDMALQNHVIKVVHEYLPLDCGYACLQTASCQSYNVRQETANLYECELSSSTKTQHPNDFLPVAGVTYYGSDSFPGLGCAAADCPNENCKETKSYPFYHCQDNAFDLKFTSTSTNHTATQKRSSGTDKLSVCFWFKTSQVDAPFLSYKNNGNPPSVLKLLYSDGDLILQINTEQVDDATIVVLLAVHNDEWHHICITWDSTSGNVSVYLNGALRTYPGGISYFKDETITLNGTFRIGHYHSTSDDLEFNYVGKISQFNIWDFVLPSNNVKKLAKNCTLSYSADGNVVAWGRDFAPTKEDTTEPRECRERDSPIGSDSDLHFPGNDDSQYGATPALSSFTISWWLKTARILTSELQIMAIASFIADQKTLLIAITGSFQIHFEIDGAQSFHKLPPINDDRWHHMAITWENEGGQWDFFLDGVHRSSIDKFRTDHVIPPSVLIAGQNGSRTVPTYSPDENLHGSLSRFNIWDKRLALELIVQLAKDPGYDQGNVISWKDIQANLRNYVNRTEPSTVVSSAGKSNIAITFEDWTVRNYARINYNDAEIGQLTVCAWLHLSHPNSYEPTLVSYSSSTSTRFNDFIISFHHGNVLLEVHDVSYGMGSEDALHNKNWRHFCVTWDSGLGHAHWYLEGVNQHSKTNLPQNEPLSSQGIWVFTNEQDTYGGGFEDVRSFKEAMAQTNVWNFVLPVKAMEGMAYGGTSVEGNLFRWSDIIANYNPEGSITEMPFHLYLADAVVQKKRDEFCNQKENICPGTLAYARVGLGPYTTIPGMEWRCYCSNSIAHDKNTRTGLINQYHSLQKQLLEVV